MRCCGASKNLLPRDAAAAAHRQRGSRGVPNRELGRDFGGPLGGQPARDDLSGKTSQTDYTGVTSTNTQMAQPKPPEKRKVAGSIPALATRIEQYRRCDSTLWMVGLVRFLSGRLICGGAVEPVEVCGYVVEFVGV